MAKPQVTMQDKKNSLANAHASTVLSSTDIERSRRFYTETLGLKLVEDNSPEQFYLQAGGGTTVMVYRRQEKPKAENTALAFDVNDIDATVANLRSRGVKFEEYNLPGLKTVKGIASQGGWRGAWFKDPDGNIIAVGQNG